MKYKIVVDKQSRTNPTADKKVYEIDVEELRYKGDIHDTLTIEKGKAYVTRRLSLSELQVLSVLETPIIEEIGNINIELFEGDNYLYLQDMTGNRLYAEYLVKNDFTEIYVTTNEMNSAINQSASQIELNVNQKLTEYATDDSLEEAVTELNSTITQKANEITSSVSSTYATKNELTTAKSEIKQTTDNITSTVSKKVGNDEIISKINQSAEAVKILANKLGLTASNIIDLIAGNTINLTSKNIVISSDCFNVNKKGIITLKDSESIGAALMIISNDNSQFNSAVRSFGASFEGPNGYVGIDSDFAYSGGTIFVAPSQTEESNYTLIQNGKVNTFSISQRSLEKNKKNFERLKESAIKIIKNIDIYKYNFKFEEDTTKKHIGFVIGDNYNYSKEITSNENDGVDLYSFVSVCCKAIQEQQEQIEQQNNLIQSLVERIEKLEAK